MLTLHKLRSSDSPFYLNGDFIGGYRWRFWAGDLAGALDLAPEPTEAEVKRLLRGEHQGKMHRSGGQRVAAVQMTISAPKSTSIAALVYGDLRVLAAHEQAVGAMLSYAQTLPFFRIQIENQKLQERAGRFLAACFHRYASRGGDPHLHTHAIVFNAGLTEDGKWRAFETMNYWHEMYLMGAIYQSRFACVLQALGYTVRWSDKGLFDLEQVDSALVERLSGRRDQIENIAFKVTRRTVAELGHKGTKAFSANSAPRVDVGSFENLAKRWQEALCDAPTSLAQPTAVAPHISWGPGQEAAEALHVAYERQRRESGGCSVSDMLLEAFLASPNTYPMDSLLASLDEEVAGGQFHLWGEPRLAWNNADYSLWLEGHFGASCGVEACAVRPGL